MAAIGSVWASGTWVSVGGWAAGTWADAEEGVITAIDDDLTTAFSKGLAALPAGPGGLNERLNAYLIDQYGASGDFQSRLARYLRDIKS